MMRYCKEEIFQILTDFYNFQATFDIKVDEEFEFTYQTSLNEWIVVCDLTGPKQLSRYYHGLFHLKRDVQELESMFLNNEKTKIGDLCEYLANHCERAKISSIVLFKQACMSAGIFRALISELNLKGMRTDNIKPSSKIIPFFKKGGGELLEVVSKMAPGTLTNFEYEDNKTTTTGAQITLIGVLFVVLMTIFWKFSWWLLIPVILGIIISKIGGWMKPKRFSVGYNTFRDLVSAIENNLPTELA